MAFVKLHDRVLMSSIMEEEIHVRLVWFLMLSLADQDGYIEGTTFALARAFNVTREQMDDALCVLTSPDPNSRSEEEEGRRLVEVGPQRWRAVNYEYYRHLASTEDKAAKNAERQRRFRAGKAAKSLGSNAPVTHRNACHDIAEAEAEADTEADKNKRTPQRNKKFTPPTLDEVRSYVAENGYTFDPEAFHAYYTTTGWKVGGKAPMKDWRSACVTWQKREGKSKAPMRVGATSTDSEWVYDSYRAADRVAHKDHERWNEYVIASANYPLRTAPTFETWLEG